MFKQKNICLIISVITAILWILLSLFTMSDVSAGLSSAEAGEAIGTAIGMALFMPYLVLALVGTILHSVGGFIYKRGLVLAGLIVECVGILLGFAWGFGYILPITLGFIGYAKMRKVKN